MKKIIRIFALATLLISHNSYAKSVSDFLDFRKKVIAAKSDSYKLTREIREISSAQKWNREKTQESLKEANDITDKLTKTKTDFDSFDDSSLDEIEEISNNITTKRQEIKDALDLQKNILTTIANSRKMALTARNKTRELLAIQTTIESFYRSKYSAGFPQSALDIVETRLKTQQQLSDIFQINNQIDEIEQKQLLGYSFIPQDDEEFYDPKTTFVAISDIKNSLDAVIKQANQDIKSSRIRMTAMTTLLPN